MSGKTRWLEDLEGFLPVPRHLFTDNGAGQLNRDAVGLFPRNGRGTFDLAVSTITLLDKLHQRLTDVWAANHPLLHKDLRLMELQKLYRAFHRTTMDATRTIVRTSRAQPLSTESLKQLAEVVKRDRMREAANRVKADQLEEELVGLRLEVAALTEKRDVQLRDPTAGRVTRYIGRLIERKRTRVRILGSELRRLGPLGFDKLAPGVRHLDDVQERLRRTLNAALLEVVKLRDAVAETPDLFAGQSVRRQLEQVLPKRPDLQLPDALLDLYVELYDLLSETTVRRLIAQEIHDEEGVFRADD